MNQESVPWYVLKEMTITFVCIGIRLAGSDPMPQSLVDREKKYLAEASMSHPGKGWLAKGRPASAKKLTFSNLLKTTPTANPETLDIFLTRNVAVIFTTVGSFWKKSQPARRLGRLSPL